MFCPVVENKKQAVRALKRTVLTAGDLYSAVCPAPPSTLSSSTSICLLSATMKFDPAALRYLSDDDFRVLTAVELGMRNHELVPVPLISTISGLRHGGYMRALKQIHKHKLVHKESARYVGYRLTTLGYDYLALRALVRREVIESVGRPLGVGKEADVFTVMAADRLMDECPELADEPMLAMKLHRLGRTSFRAVKSKRDYLVHRKAASWIYFSRLAAMKEYAFMCALHERGFPVPRPLGQSRHVVVMQLCKGTLLTQVSELDDPVNVANSLLSVAIRFAQHGLVHCDLNEFNVLVDDDKEITVIDFPQMVSTSHTDAKQLFERDVDGIRRFFEHRFSVPDDQLLHPDFDVIIAERGAGERIDTIVSASGFQNSEYSEEIDSHHELGNKDGIEKSILDGIDLKSLQISAHGEESNDEDETDTQLGEIVSGSEPSVSHAESTDCTTLNSKIAEGPAGIGDSDEDHISMHSQPAYENVSLNHAAIQARVRKQRANQNQRRQLAKRNIVKDSQKRKVKAEIGCEMWQ